MKLKRILKFYFSAEKLNKSLDGTITRYALASADYSVSAESCAEKICAVIETKKAFSQLNGIMCKFGADEVKTLEYYANLRGGILKLPEGARREIKRVLTKFSRKGRGIERFKEGLRAVDAYFAVL